MNISKEETGTLSACISIEILPDDYQEKVNKKLKEYQKKSNIPGFRPGMVPVNMIKKMYGKSILADEIDKILRETLENYLKENNIKTLGTPIANEEKSPEIDWDNPVNFVFHFDIGIQPEFEVDLNPAVNVDYYKIVPTDDELEKEIGNIRRSYGTFSEVPESGDDDWITVDLKELDENGRVMEGGLSHNRRITASTFTDESMKPRLTGLKPGDKMIINPRDTMGGDPARMGYLLGISKEQAGDIQHDFEMTVTKVERLDLPELIPAFFDQVFPGQQVETEEDFKKLLSEDISLSYKRESDTTFYRAVRKKLMDDLNFSLPEDFLKKWLKERQEDQHEHEHDHEHEHEHTHETEEPDYEKVFASMKWQLIENQIIEKYNIKIEPQQVRDHVKERYRRYFSQQGALSGEPEQIDKALESLVNKYMEKREEVEEIYDILYFNELVKLYKETLSLNQKEITHDAFHEIAEQHHQHSQHH